MSSPETPGASPAPKRVAHSWETATYPLLVIRLTAAVYSLRPLAEGVSREVLTALAWAAMDACERKYQMCLVFAPNDALYLFPDGRAIAADNQPGGGFNPGFYPPELDFLPGPGEGSGADAGDAALDPPGGKQGETPAAAPARVTAGAAAREAMIQASLLAARREFVRASLVTVPPAGSFDPRALPRIAAAAELVLIDAAAINDALEAIPYPRSVRAATRGRALQSCAAQLRELGRALLRARTRGEARLLLEKASRSDWILEGGMLRTAMRAVEG